MSGFFVDLLEQHGNAVALIDEDRATVGYANLAARADALAAEIGATPRLVLLEAVNTVDTVVAMLACLRGRHPLIVGSDATRARIEAAFHPEIVIDRNGARIERRDAAPVALHPDLAIMLSTSGSTGATKLVRLSRAALHANAASIVDYLAIGNDDRALTSLPVSYSYGLSVLNSHLLAGASVVLTDRSVVDDALWALFDDTEATSIAGVPYTYELLEAVGFRDAAPATLRTMTQAGGRLSPELVATYAAWGRDRGVSFYTMYGQTEATARMAYLPPDLMEGHSDCIGKAIPGGALRLIDEGGRAVAKGETGELVYTGANVMMGYATAPEDLAKGAELDELRTGDLGQEVEDGLFRIVGRSSRFSKIAGLRVSLDEIEGILKESGIPAVAAGNDALVAIAVADAAQVARAERVIAQRTTIPTRASTVVALDPIPRLTSGKVDYPAILAAGRAAMEASEAAAERDAKAVGGSALARVYARALNRREVKADDSFTSLAGDSLAYIEVSMAIERTLGHLPEHWEQLTLHQIDTLAASRPAVPERRHFRSVATEMLIRPVAMTMIVTGHVGGGAGWKGGALALLMTAGYNSSRFQRDKLVAPSRAGLILQFFGRFLIPFYLLITVKAILPGEADINWATPLLLNSYLRVEELADFDRYWFLEALFHCLLIMVVLFSIPPVRRFAVQHRWWFGLILLAVAVVFKFGTPPLLSDETNEELIHRLDGWGYAFALGWLVGDAQGLPKRLFCVAAAFVLSGLDWGFGDLHNIMLVVAVVLILFLPRVSLWAPLAVGMAFFAQSTFYIYLSHGVTARIVNLAFHGDQPIALTVACAVIVGMIGYIVWRNVELQAAHWFRRLRGLPQHSSADL